MTLTEHELRDFMELNLELGETLAVVTQKIFDFADKHDLPFPERPALEHLLKRTASILSAIRDQPPGKLPVYPRGSGPVAINTINILTINGKPAHGFPGCPRGS